MKNKIILAYSGGLDTSVILKWLVNLDYEVVCFIGDIGQSDDFITAKSKAEELGLDFNWELITVPNVGHDNYKLAPFASIYLFGDEEE